MATERRRQLLLGAVVLVLALAIYWQWTTRAAQNTAAPARVPEVHLQALENERSQPGANGRNLFRFKPKPAPPPPPAAPPPNVAQPTAPVTPSGPPPPPPITLKFIGIVEATEHPQKIAILSDGRNPPFYGKEGAIIEGRYRILKIGVESIEIAYVDGRGRQTIRLTGG
jgi:hypothetical protein